MEYYSKILLTSKLLASREKCFMVRKASKGTYLCNVAYIFTVANAKWYSDGSWAFGEDKVFASVDARTAWRWDHQETRVLMLKEVIYTIGVVNNSFKSNANQKIIIHYLYFVTIEFR